MRCLYCGKHLPLFRKLTGGGEFCSDAHRDKYQEEYNRLAVSRLLQAQTRPEEPKASKKAEPEIAHAAVAVAAEEPEFSTSFIAEFRPFEIVPAMALEKLRPVEVEPVFAWAPQVSLPTLPSGSSAPPAFAGFVPFQDGVKRLVATPREAESAIGYTASEQIFPVLPNWPAADPNPDTAQATPFTDRPVARNTPIEIRTASVDSIDPQVQLPEIPASGLSLSGKLSGHEDLPKAGKIAFDILIAAPEEGSAEIELLQEFAGLFSLQSGFDTELAVMAAEPEPEAQPEPASIEKAVETEAAPEAPITEKPVETREVTVAPEAAPADGVAETQEIPDEASPRMALAALSNLHVAVKAAEPIAPPASQMLRRIALPAVAPSAAVLTPGFDCVPIQTLPRMQRYTTQPLRPKMVLVTVSRPSPNTATPVGKNPAKELKAVPKSIDNNGAGKHEPPKHGSRSMLHLDEESSASTEPDTAPESGTLFGKLGGLFGKKHKGS